MATTSTATTTIEALPPLTTWKAQMRNNDKHWIWKIGLRCLLLLVDIIGIGAVASAVAQLISFPQSTQSGFGFFFFPWGLVSLGTSIIWCSIVIAMHLTRRRPPHPGVVVGLDLILWLIFGITFALIAVAMSVWNENARERVSEVSDYKHSVGVLATTCQGLALVLHLVLFIFACVDTHRFNRRIRDRC